MCGGCKPAHNASYHLWYAISNRLCCVSIISRKRRFSSVMQLFPATFSLAGYISFHCGSINDVFLRSLVFLSFSFFFEIPIYFINFYKLLLFSYDCKKMHLRAKVQLWWYSFLYIIRKGKKSFINDSLTIIKKKDVQLFIISWLSMTDKVRRRENIFNDQRKLKLRKKNRTIKDYRFIVI